MAWEDDCHWGFPGAIGLPNISGFSCHESCFTYDIDICAHDVGSAEVVKSHGDLFDLLAE